MQPTVSFLSNFLRFFFYLLYQPFAWTYDLVAWVVSLGRWKVWVYSVLPELAGPRVLELGFGPGHLQVAMRKQGLLAFGADRSMQMNHIASAHLRKLNFLPLLSRASGRQLPFATSSFDQIVATFPTEYILLPQTLSEIRRTLKPSGMLVLLPVAWITAKDPLNRALAWLFQVTGQAPKWTGNFSEAIRRAGFKVVENRVSLDNSEVMLLICTPG